MTNYDPTKFKRRYSDNKIIQKKFKVDAVKAAFLIDKVTEYNIKDTNDMFRVIKRYILK